MTTPPRWHTELPVGRLTIGHYALAMAGSPFELEDAVEAGDLVAVRALLNQGADPNSRCHGLDQPLAAVALRRGDIAMLRLLKEHGADLRAASPTPILHAAATAFDGNALLPELIQLGFDPNEPDHAGWTPLISAAALGYSDNVEALLQAGADPSIQTPAGLTPAVAAERNGHVQVAVRLTST